MTALVWCVRHRNGWCAVAVGDGQRPDEDATQVPTACDHVVVFPYGTALRRPDCSACVRALTADQPA